MENYPYAFYGIFRKDYHPGWESYPMDLGDYLRPTEIPNADIYGAGIAHLVPGDGTVKAWLWQPRPEYAAQAQCVLDQIEGAYDRTLWTLADGTQAWVYVYRRYDRAEEWMTKIPDGDWLAYR